MNLTPHFTLEELVHSDTAVRLGIDNAPPAGIVDHLRVLAGGLEEIRDMLGKPLRILSGYRCEALERVLTAKDFAAWCKRRGGEPDDEMWAKYFAGKAHPQGFAGDFTCQAFGTPAQIVKLVAISALRFDQLIEEGTWAHASFAPAMRRTVMSATFAPDGTPTYTLA